MTATSHGQNTDAMRGGPVLEVNGLVMHYRTKGGDVSAVDNVTFSLMQGEALGLVGESGSGKTSIAMTLIRLLTDNAIIKQGEVLLDGVDVTKLSDQEMRKHRWADVSMVFQGAMNAWNPVYRVGDQIVEALEQHFPDLSEPEGRGRIAELFEMVGLPAAMVDRYPHELSGGMRQRAVLAMALSCNPKLIIADEPTTALDVIVQDQILKELKKVQINFGMSIIYISHDVAVIAEVSDRIGVMYAGKIVELGPTDEVFSRPRHPYTYLLLSSIPSVKGPRRRLAALKGESPNLLDPPSGCRFHPRCPFATELCAQKEPPHENSSPGHQVACWHWEEIPGLGRPTA
jgi:peptide/nickel transport system ATP-binding protein